VAAGARAVRPADEVRRSCRGAGGPRRAGVQPVRAAGRAPRRGGPGGDHVDGAAEHDRLPAHDGAWAGGVHPGPAAAPGPPRPDLAEKSAYTGLKWVFGYMCAVAAVYLTLPGLLVSLFEGGRDPETFAAVAAIVPGLLVCVAAYSVVESANVTFAFALRGAGDTRFVTLATFCLAWPIMVLPTYLVVRAGGSVNWAWWFATAHVFAMAACFYLRFRSGKWKTMRVIEQVPSEDGVSAPQPV